MAKQPEVRDRFRISAETSSEAMGPLLAQLTRMGLENIGYELITDVRRFTQNGERQVHDTTGNDFAKTYVIDHPTFRARDLIQHFRDVGRSEGSGHSAIRNLVNQKIITKLGLGNYQRSDVKAIPPPSTETEKKKRGQVGRYDLSNDTVILRFIRRRKRITVQETGAHLEAKGRNKKSASPIISRFASEGLLKQVEPGVYNVMTSKLDTKMKTKGGLSTKEKDRLRAQARRDAAKAAKLNGQGDTAHG